jgi:3-hydroxy-9,10-secoandrosta-1,3,5(10)-triene-9,17-dione monooxygenase reductase component
LVALEPGTWNLVSKRLRHITYHASRITHHASRITYHEVFMPEPDTIKSILRMFNYGLFVAASTSPDGPRAATVSWATQASFEPKLIAVAMRKGTAICEAVQASQRFALHVVGAHQADFAKAFFKAPLGAEGEMGGYRYGLSERGVPILGAAAAWLECEVVEEVNRSGDHAIFIASIVDGDVPVPGMEALALRDTPWHYGG